MIKYVAFTRSGVNGSIRSTWHTLMIEFAFAIIRPASFPEIPIKKSTTCFPNSRKIMEQTIVPEMLNSRWTHAARFASFLQPKLARIADIVHPMLHPSIINRQIGSPIKPSLARSMMIPTVAELLCRIAVATQPTKNARNGFVRDPRALTTAGISFASFRAPEIPEIPINRIPNPKITSPRRLIVRLFFTNITIRTPMMTNSGAISARSNAISCPVTVVPMFAPRIIPGACASFIRPEFTKLTTITVVALED